MNTLKFSIENYFDALTRAVFRYRWVCLSACLILLGLPVSQLHKTNFDASTNSFFHKNDPTLIVYEAFQEQFGRDDVVLVAITPPKIFELEFLRKLKDFHQELENTVPYLDDVRSLINITTIWGSENELMVDGLMEDFPKNQKELDQKTKRLKATPLHRNLIISKDGKRTCLLLRPVARTDPNPMATPQLDFAEEDMEARFEPAQDLKPLTESQTSAFIQAIYDIAGKYNSDQFPIQITGSRVIISNVKDHLKTDTPRFVIWSALIGGLLLFMLFRRFSGVFLPLAVVFATLMATVGIMAFFGVPITMVTQTLPGFLLVVGLCDSVHILSFFYARVDRGDKKEDAMVDSMRHCGLAVTMTSLTTAGSLISFIPAKLLPVSDLGVYAALGVLIALLLSVIMLPAMVAIIPIRLKQAVQVAEKRSLTPLMDRFLTACGRLATTCPKTVVAGALLMTFWAILGITRLSFSQNHLAWLPENEPIKSATRTVDKRMAGSVTAEFIVDTGRENGLYAPETMQKLAQINQRAEMYRFNELFVGKSFSVVDILTSIHQALNENRPEFHIVPDDKKVIAQELLLFENGGGTDLERMVDSQFQKARITMKFPWRDANEYVGVLEDLESMVGSILKDTAKVTRTGVMVLMTENIHNLMHSMVRSYLIAGIVITGMMICFMRSWTLGLIAMLPNYLPIALGLGLMGFFNFRLDVSSILCGSFAIGLVVDDTIHFMHNYKRFYAQSPNVVQAVNHTLLTTGRAMTVTSLVLIAGFLVYMMAYLKNVQIMGMVCAFIVATALVADFLFIPAIMVLIDSKRSKHHCKTLLTQN